MLLAHTNRQADVKFYDVLGSSCSVPASPWQHPLALPVNRRTSWSWISNS
ncbi:MAG: hypothetical protein HYV16_06620 [Gammaproteobacteria bacterium]|nr:hypothetical protein [Gammaproteobacteria bacterium]